MGDPPECQVKPRLVDFRFLGNLVLEVLLGLIGQNEEASMRQPLCEHKQAVQKLVAEGSPELMPERSRTAVAAILPCHSSYLTSVR